MRGAGADCAHGREVMSSKKEDNLGTQRFINAQPLESQPGVASGQPNTQPTLETALEIVLNWLKATWPTRGYQSAEDFETHHEDLAQRISQALLAARQQQKEADAKFLDDQGHPLAAALLRGRK